MGMTHHINKGELDMTCEHKFPNADLCTTATQNDPQGHNPVFARLDDYGRMTITSFDKTGAARRTFRPMPCHIIRFWKS